MNTNPGTNPSSAASDESGRSFTIDYELARPPATVWRTLTEPALLAAWLMDNDIRPVVGHRFTFKAPAGNGWDGVVHCQVLAVEPNRRISYTWGSGLDKGQGDPGRLDTVVTWTLTPTDAGGTLLRLEHTGFLPVNSFAFKGAQWGWRSKFLPRLAESVAVLS